MKRQVRSYKIMLKAHAEQKRKNLMEQRMRLMELKKRKKQAVLLIEKERYKQLHRRECRLLRKYLARLPVECRALYFKFVDLKKNSHMLANDFVGYMQDAHRIKVVDTVQMRYAQ